MHDIPELKQTRLQKLIERFKTAPSLVLSSMFGEDRWESEDIDWESQYGSCGLTPFGSEDAPAPLTGEPGIAKHTAKAAYWHEKIFGPASKLNNLRQPGTREGKMRAEKWLAQQMQGLRHRADRRKEWMFCKMLQAGGFAYYDEKMNKVAVDYGIPSSQIVTLGNEVKWNTAGANIVSDIMDAQIALNNKGIGQIDYALFTAELLKVMVLDKSIQTLLQKSAFGNGDLLVRPRQVLGSLLNIQNMVQYDESFEIRGWLTAALPAGAGPHTLSVDNTADFEVGQTLYVKSTSTKRAPEPLTITAVSHTSRTITATGTLSYPYLPVEDFFYVSKKFLDTDKFTMFCSTVEGRKIAEFAQAPFGNEGNYGVSVDSWPKKDPDGVYIRVQNKGLPVMYFEDAVYTLDVM